MKLGELKATLLGLHLSVLCTRGKGDDGRWVAIGQPDVWKLVGLTRKSVILAPYTIHGEPNTARRASFKLPEGIRETEYGATYLIHPEQAAKLATLVAGLAK